jgi:hypothetical protein
MSLRSAGREEEAAVRWDVAADLEDDLGAVPESQRARIAAPTEAVDVHRDNAAESGEPIGSERLPPDAEEAAQRRAAFVVDDPARIGRPDLGAAAGGDDATEAPTSASEPDRSGHDHDPPPREQLDMDAWTGIQRRRPAREPCGSRMRGRVVAVSCADRGRDRAKQRGHRDHRGQRKGSRLHRRQATRAVLCLLACSLVAGLAAPAGRADGDPASDYLVSQQVFLSYDAKIPAAAQRKLLAAVASANRNGFPVRVALIWSSYDLGSVPELFGKPQTYARFLDAEDSKCWWGASCGTGRFKTTTRLLVVMPNGLGFAQWKHDPAAGYRTLAGITVPRTPAGLATAATAAVVKLARASGVKVSTRGGSSAPAAHPGGGTSRTEIILAIAVALLLGVGARLLIRRRATRSALR